MSKLVASEFVSLDGYMVGPDEDMSWVIEGFVKEIQDDETEMFGHTKAFVFGRITYDILAGYWPNAIPYAEGDLVNPASGKEDPVMIERINNLPKIVFSRTRETTDWNNSKVIKGDLGNEISKLKEEPGEDLVIIGSQSIVQAFSNLGLIDEYWLKVHPIVLGAGKPLFQNVTERTKLRLIESKTYSNGVIGLRYERT